MSCGSEFEDTTAENLQSINVIRNHFIKAFSQCDEVVAATLYTFDSKIQQPNIPDDLSEKHMQALFQNCHDAGASDLLLNVIDISVHEEWAHEVGNYSLTKHPEKGKIMSEVGNYVIIWVHDYGIWKLLFLKLTADQSLPLRLN